MNQPPVICPVCAESLVLEERSYRCANSHSFDLAKEGYVNLLLSHQRRSKNPGDDKAMIQARRRFFDSGPFGPVAEWIKENISGSAILDCGCGEGHFLGALSETVHAAFRLGSAGGVALPENSKSSGGASLSERAGQLIGIDISKDAVRLAAKRYRNATWIVANGMRQLPFCDDSMDVILSILAPRNADEFARILKPDGKLILGVPGPNHLIELRRLLSAHAGDFEEKADEAVEKCAPRFAETKRDNLLYEITLGKKQITDLIQMTPIFWNSSPEAKERVQQIEALTVTVSFALVTLTP